jgi:hypothetical protein
VAGLLCDPLSGRVGGAADEVDAAAAHLDEEEHVQPLKRDPLDREEVDCEDALRRLAQRNVRQDTPERSPAGPRPASRRIFRTVVAETLTPSPLISPTIRW